MTSIAGETGHSTEGRCGYFSDRAFTLLELLVVIGIMSTLVAILVPSLAASRRAAKQVACASNLRQWGMATRLYAEMYDGYLPRRGQGVQPTQRIDRPSDWFNALPVVMGMRSYQELANAGQVPRPWDRSCFSCPEAVDNGKPFFWSYGMNMWLSVWNNGINDLPDRMNAVGPPVSMVLFADGPGDYSSISPAPSPSYSYSPIARHGGRVNICFLDSHVEIFSGRYVGCEIGFVEHSDVRWRVPGSDWHSAQH